jgi:hypothetical protein
MAEEKSLDLSQVSVANLLNNDAPTSIPEPEESVASEVTEETPEPEVEQEAAVQEEPEAQEADEPVSQPVAESEDTEESVSEEEASIIDTLRQKMGYEVAGDFSEDYDGVVNFTTQVANEIAKEQLDTVFSQFPDVEEYLQFRYNGGDPKKYFQATSPNVDFGAIELTDEDVSMQRMVVQEFLSRQGYQPDEISETVQEYVEAGILMNQATRSLGKLKIAQEREAKQLVEQQKAQAEEQQKQVQQQWGAIQQTIDRGVVKGFAIPNADRKKFFSWMSDAVDNQGRTQRLVDREQMDLETQVAMEYLLWKKFDLSKLVSNTQNTKKAQNLKQKLQQKKPANQRMKGGQSSYKAPKKLPSLKDLL